MEGFNEDDTIPSFNASELIEEVDDDDNSIGEEEIEVEEESNDENGDDSENEDEDKDDESSSMESYEGTYRNTKRFKKMTSDESSFKIKVLSVLRKSCEVAGDFAVSGKLERTPLIVISLKVRN